jgi:outer membrane protein OmpA-like peptidoglycan-associated protein
MNDNPRLRLVIEGHTHNDTAASSLVVGEWRRLLEAIKSHLVAAGVDERRLSTAFMGDYYPIANNATADGRARNTRIEFRDVDCTDVHVP